MPQIRIHLGSFLILSNDSDPAFPIATVRNRFGKQIGLINPHQEFSRALRPLAHFVKQVRKGALDTGVFRKPASW